MDGHVNLPSPDGSETLGNSTPPWMGFQDLIPYETASFLNSYEDSQRTQINDKVSFPISAPPPAFFGISKIKLRHSLRET